MKKKYAVIDIVFFIVLLAILSFFFGRLVYCQAICAGTDAGYPSDILAYMLEMQGKNSGYPFPYPIFFKAGSMLCKVMPIEYAVTVLEVFFNALAIVITKYYFEKYVSLKKDCICIHLLISVVVISVFLLSMWWLPRFGTISLPHKDQVYKGTLSGNPWHNATYIATRPFAILAFFQFVEILDNYEQKVEVKKTVLFGISLLLTTLAKPSFTFVMVSAAGLWMAFRLVKNKFSTLKNAILLGCAFIPTFVTLLFQFSDVFGKNSTYEEHGVGFCFFSVWKIHNIHVPEAIFYANAFSLVCFAFFVRDIVEDKKYRFTVFLFAISIIEAGVFCEKGIRYPDFNFGWGYVHGIFFLELYSTIMLFIATLQKRKSAWKLIVCWLFFLIHLVMGILYFKGLYCGLDYDTLLPVTWL